MFQEGPFGGTCLNDGCRPTKALRASAHAAHAARTSAPYGVHVEGVTVNVAEAVERKDAIIGAWRDGATDYYENHETISYVTARARLSGKDGDNYLVTFDGTTVRAPRIILNPGARSVPPPIDGLDAIDYLDHHTLLDLKEAPGHLVVIGGSYIGLELGQVWSRFGSHVTILEQGEHVISREDHDMSDAIAAMLRDEGLDVRTGVAIERVEAAGRGRRGGPGRRRASRVRPHPGGRGPHPQQRRPRARHGRRLDRQARLHHDRRALPHLGPRHLRGGRRERPRRVHAHELPGPRDPGRPPRGRRPLRRGTNPDLRPLHRPASRSGGDDARPRLARRGSTSPWRTTRWPR